MEYQRRSIPSISGLIAFEATARHLNFSRAAEDLALTQGAVSKRVRQLETVLGIQLLVRNTNQVCLTEVGKTYLDHVRKLLYHLQISTDEIRSRARGKASIAVALPSVLAIRWLMPRLIDFQRAFPAYSVDLRSLCPSDTTQLAEVDCAICDSPLLWREACATLIAATTDIVVASPAHLERHRPATLKELARASLLQFSREPKAWPDWFSAAGQTESISGGARFDDQGVVIEAALQGQGFALLPQFLVEDDIRRGRLVHLFPGRFLRGRQYHLYVPRRFDGCGAVDAFRRWLSIPALAKTG